MLKKLKETGFQRLTEKDALALFADPSPIDMGEEAFRVRTALHAGRAHYAVNAAVTYSNTCEALCPICSFARREGDAEAYVLTPAQARQKAAAFSAMGAEEIHIIGGMYSKLPLSYYADFVKAVKEADSKLNIVAFTVSECVLMSRVSGRPLEEVLKILMDAGVGALPGGGAEIFDEGIRRKISPNKLSADEWLSAMRTAHECGLRTNATMLFGHIESPENVVDHLIRLRDLQDETGGFKAFVPLPFRKGKSPISSKTSGVYDLKICALARLMLDNFEHIRVPITHFDARVSEILLHFGADDVGGTHWSEEVAVAAGAAERRRDEQFLKDAILSAGFEPVKGNSNYGA